mmetsp:Transcript_73933/g.149510  ORF Transcript_73933/g.149510 Transcript_73933/m.149510 type:complete len:88 (-) Transcript_73933:1043-1306(-)
MDDKDKTKQYGQNCQRHDNQAKYKCQQHQDFGHCATQQEKKNPLSPKHAPPAQKPQISEYHPNQFCETNRFQSNQDYCPAEWIDNVC